MKLRIRFVRGLFEGRCCRWRLLLRLAYQASLGRLGSERRTIAQPSIPQPLLQPPSQHLKSPIHAPRRAEARAIPSFPVLTLATPLTGVSEPGTAASTRRQPGTERLA